MFRISIALLLLAAPAHAGGLTVSDCALRDDDSGWMDCSFTNTTDTPVAMFTFETTIRETGRTVPWISPKDQLPSGGMPVNGGIEPDETVQLLIRLGYLDARANREKLAIEVNITGIFDVNGNPITD